MRYRKRANEQIERERRQNGRLEKKYDKTNTTKK